METSIIFLGNSGYVELGKLLNPVTSTYANTATVTAAISSLSGTVIETINMAYVTGSDGKYLGSIPYTAAVVAGTSYKLRIVANQSGLVFDETTQVIAKIRTNTATSCDC